MGMSLVSLNKSREVEPFAFDVAGMREAADEIKAARVESGGGDVVFRVKVASGGGKAFSVETGDDDMDTTVSTFSGVIIHNHKCNACFDESAAGNTPPICSSDDGIMGVVRENGECRSCSGCPLNEYGSSSKGAGKACKNMHRLYILTEGCPVPFLLSIPPTSLKNWQTYRSSTLAALKRIKPHEAVTEFSLETKTSQGGQKYSVVKFKLLGALTGEAKATAQYFADGFRAVGVPEITGDDYNRASGDGNAE